MTPVLAAAEYGGDFSSAFDNIGALFNFPPIIELSIGGLDLSINRTILIALLMNTVAFLLLFLAFRNAKVVPGKLQAAGELVVDFVRSMAIDIIGPRGVKFVPLLTTLFVGIFFLNLAKITPFIMLPPTGLIAWPAFLALISWVVYIGVGIKEHGLGYFKAVLFPSGVPWVMYFLLTPIEFLSNFILRPITLALRLFANMVAGHILVVLTLVTVHVFLYFPDLRPSFFIGVFGLFASPFVMGFELAIIALQAYIFTLLTAVYIDSSIETH
ncbi:F0F1 ATP synthase subunit A [Nitriliruptoraceae bacterium ZYF776]|nr:F0F1 ATP synthase subunit A [Profundirhabdus halotolerans]